MKLIIHIPEDLLENIKEDNCSMRDMQTLLRIIKNGIPLNDKTNGDIIKALFPDCLISEGENYVSFWYTKEENGRYVNFRKFWWEEPYKENQPKELRCDTCKWNDEELSGECYDCVKGIEDRYEPIEESEEKYITAEEYMKTGKWIGD